MGNVTSQASKEVQNNQATNTPEIPGKTLDEDEGACCSSAAWTNDPVAGGSGLNDFLLRQRSERLAELRSLKDGTKAVTEGKSRQKINRFVTRVVFGENVNDSDSTHSDDSSQSLATGGQQQEVVLEVRSLFEQRPVSSVLQSNSFRSQLENIIRGNVIRQERELEAALRLRNAGFPSAVGGASLTNSISTQNSDVLSEVSVRSLDSGHFQIVENHNVMPPLALPLPEPWNLQQMDPSEQQLQSSSMLSEIQNVMWMRSAGVPAHVPPPPPALSSPALPPPALPPPAFPPPALPPPALPPPALPPPALPTPALPPPAFPPLALPPPALLPIDLPQPALPPPALPARQQYSSAARWQPPSQYQAQPWYQRLYREVGGVAGMSQSPWVVRNREQIISDISELVHNQMVTQALGSDFRDSLEIVVQNRLAQSRRDGQRALNVVHNLPRNVSYRRNDFSHIGTLFSPPATSSEGATAAPVGPWNRLAQSSRDGQRALNVIHNLPRNVSYRRNDFSHLGTLFSPPAASSEGATAAPVGPWVQDMSSLKVQMSELQNLVRLSFDLQLDLQRAIRQEVAAAMSDVHGLEGSPQVSDVSLQRGNQPASEGHCIICLDNSVDSVLYQCGHMCVCLTCGLRLKQMNAHCPMCRAPIRDVIRAYRCHRE